MCFNGAAAPCDPRYEVLNATTGACDCKSGFTGMGCQMCAATASCQAIDKAMECVDGMTYRPTSDHKTYDCELDPAIQVLLPDGQLAMECNRTTTNCTAAIFKAKDTVKGKHVIDCTLSTCTFEDGSANAACKLIECKCSDVCSAITKTIVEKSLSGKPVNIKSENATRMTLEIEGSPIPLSGTCKASACEATGHSSGSGSHSSSGGGGGKPVISRGVLIALIACATIAAAVLLCVCICSCCVRSRIKRGQKDVESELLALSQSRSGAVLEFNRIHCTAPPTKQSAGEERVILQDISGRVERGCVLGLLGPSGSGKTSLLNALAAVENGHSVYSGEVLVDGKKASKRYRQIAAYVQQDDTLFSTLTVRECIQYSAQLRLPASVTDAVKNAMVDRVIDELNLTHVANSRIGSSGKSRGVSGGERRRVSIGMELVTSPQILFLDEPTSGLDSSSANSVVQLLKVLASHGRIVVLSIHQPSAKAFQQLDQVMLLAKGKMLYNGSPLHAKPHFEELGFICPENENIADFILDIAADPKNIPVARSAAIKVRGDQRSKTLTIPDTPSESSPFMNADSSLDTPRVQDVLGSPSKLSSCPTTPTAACSPASPPDLEGQNVRSVPKLRDADDAKSRSIYVEIYVLFRRTGLNIFRHRSLLMLHLFLSVILGLFGGLIFNHVTNDLAGFQNRSGAFYFILTFFGFASLSSMDLFIAERPIFLRETGAMYYSAFSYFLAKAVLDTLLLRVLPATIFACIFYWIMGLQPTLEHFAMFIVTLILFNIAAGSISILIGVLCRTVGAANLSATVALLIMLLFGGFLLNSQTMPVYVAWLKHFSIFSYAFEILMTNELKGLLLKFDAPGYPSIPVYGDVFLKTLGMEYENRYYDLLALSLIAFCLQLLSFLFLTLQVPIRHEIAELNASVDSTEVSEAEEV
ncbi:TPA: hypothetical protein N0F65_002081 [Lagenidium giganteum]|uniref:ABC transporter domain-containing protein n=1 Tax=Lagenidium giganteum TaxID=4803 RepID=A0AAV2ZHH6_9STRA|nr:TPA: hypothetical protein N0F65_002081 [Lagenidium giganteum]